VEKLSPADRAVFVLREGSDYPDREIAEMLELSERTHGSCSSARAPDSGASAVHA
jgi:DNA-directed RNA polymerase specialized sigma24 family protein